MPYQVRHILDGLTTPVSARPEDSLRDALRTMLHLDYGQLPVVWEEGDRGRFLVTTKSTLATLSHFGLSPAAEGLQVRDAMVRVPRVYLADDDLFELFGGISELGAALVVDEHGSLANIVTSYDVTQYFRRWSEDLMYVRDVEQSLKRLINLSFYGEDGALNEQARQGAIDELTPSHRSLRRRFRSAVESYLNSMQLRHVQDLGWTDEALLAFLNAREANADRVYNDGDVSQRAVDEFFTLRARLDAAKVVYLQRFLEAIRSVDDDGISNAFPLIQPDERGRAYDTLTLDTYVKLFLRDDGWARYGDVFGISREAVRTLLEGVRDTRNKLAHFREDEIAQEQRMQLASCADWLTRYESEFSRHVTHGGGVE